MSTRIIGFRHRVKKTRDGAASPTQVSIFHENHGIMSFDLETDTDELDFLLGRHPVSYRPYIDGEDLTGFLTRHLKTKSVDDGNGGKKEIVTKVPSSYDGLTSGDKLVMILGGSGDRIAFAASTIGKKIGASVHRVAAQILKTRRGSRSKDEDTTILIELFKEKPEQFFEVSVRDREQILVRRAYYNRRMAQKARIGTENRLGSLAIDEIFFSEEGIFPEGLLEDEVEAFKKGDAVLAGLVEEEKQRTEELKSAVEKLDVWKEIFSPIKGVGPVIAAGVVVAVGDVRRFSTKHKLKKFLGVAVDTEGRFPRRRAGVASDWHPNGRQALYLLADQFNRRPDSVWGMKLREIKSSLRAKHPIECSVCGVPVEQCKNMSGEKTSGEKTVKHTRRYTDGHIHRMAVWKTLNKFVVWLYREWWNLELRRAEELKAGGGGLAVSVLVEK